MMYAIVLLLHVLAATVWTGGHLVLALAVLPRALRERSAAELLRFESAYERIGLPALLIQVVTGLWLAYRMVPGVRHWIDFDHPVSALIAAKLFLLAMTVMIAAHARFRIIPTLSSRDMTALAWHIITVTVIAVLMVVIGVSFRTGWFFSA